MEKFITIRKATPDDIGAVMEIEHLSFHPDVVESEKVFKDRIAAFPDGFLVAEIESDGRKRIAGCISSELWKYSKDIPYSNFNLNHSVYETHSDDGDELYISSIAVLPEVRGGKIGGQLFTALIDGVFKKYKPKSAILLVCGDWRNAYEMYRKEGFVTVDCIPRFFPAESFAGGGDLPGVGIIMRKRLSGQD